MESSVSTLSPSLGSTTTGVVVVPEPTTSNAGTAASIAQDHTTKLGQMDPSVAAATTAAAVAWPSRAEFPAIGFEQPTPEQLIQQEMLSQSRNLLMQSMAAREMATAESSLNKNYAFTTAAWGVHKQ
ncbi:hypothetical protein BX616_001494 [Lobosporangium transversale]|nr:hypothetical protein BX616_001494 [Lobosporangium transversale]